VECERSKNSTRRNMKNLFVSAGLVAVGAATLQSAMATPASPQYWNVAATLRGFYDDNYNITGTTKGSFGVELLPSVSFHVPLQQTDMGIRYTYGLYYYEDRDSIGVNPFDQSHQVDLWVDHAFNERWHAKLTDTFAAGQEPELLQPNPLGGQAITRRISGDNISNHGSAALSTDWTRLFSTVLTYDNSIYDYANSGAQVKPDNGVAIPSTVSLLSTPGTAGWQMWKDSTKGTSTLAGVLDRVEESASLDLKWHLQPETTVVVGYQFSWVNYTGNEPIAVVNYFYKGNVEDPRSFVYRSSDRDNVTHYGYVGVEQQFTPSLTGMVRGGASYTDSYADPLNSNTSFAPYADVSLSYTYTPGSYVQLGFTHDINATDQILPNAAGQITQYAESSVVYLDVNHKLTSKLMATLIGRVQYSTFNGGLYNSSDETTYSAGLNLSYQINQHLSVDTGYNYDYLETTIPGLGYTRNRVYLGLTANY